MQARKHQAAQVNDIRFALISHYRRTKRDLPWRQTRDPYLVWVSEIMLQQTQVATATPYYERFVARFPTMESLAAATEQQVLKIWEGLGYYSRARNLHRAARRLVSSGLALPSTAEALRELPGIGRYTAGAIASIAFGEIEPAVDGNARRALSRLFVVRGDVSRGEPERKVWEYASILVACGDAAEINQALMEFGATVCSPRPRCSECALSSFCLAHRKGIAALLPELPKRNRPLAAQEACAVIVHNDRALLVRRPDRGTWAGMWEFPRVDLLPNEEAAEGAIRAAKAVGMLVRATTSSLHMRYTVMNRRVRLCAVKCQYVRGDAIGEAIWTPIDTTTEYPMPIAQRKAARKLFGDEDYC